MRTYCFIIFTVLIADAISQNASAQKNASPAFNLYNTSRGAILISNVTDLNIERKTGAADFKTIGRLEMKKDPTVFRNEIGDKLWNSLKTAGNFKTDGELWQKILSTPKDPNVRDLNLLSASGFAYTDSSILKIPAGTKLTYKINNIEKTITTGQYSEMCRPLFHSYLLGDSLVTIKWFDKPGEKDPSRFANVYKQSDGKGRFEKVAQKIPLIKTGDSIVIFFQDRVMPNTFQRYFVRPVNLVGDEGASSDTSNVLAVFYKMRDMITGFNAQDTSGGIYLSWHFNSLPVLFSGIQILRSKQPQDNYVELTVLPAEEKGFLDTRVIPGVVYYYQARALTIDAQNKQGYSFTSAMHHNSDKLPQIPEQLVALNNDKNILLKWSEVSDPDFSAYFVYRKYHFQDSLTLIGGPIKTNSFIDSSKSLNGRYTYFYAVTSFNKSGKESGFSNLVHLSPAREVLPKQVPGLCLSRLNGKLVLQWSDVSRSDPAIIGYNVYRLNQENASSRKTGNANYEKVNTSLIQSPYFEIDSGTGKRKSGYAVTSVDIYGKESNFSFTAF